MDRFKPLLGLLAALSWGLAAGPAAAQQAATEIVAFGDSLSAGYGVEPGKAFPEQLQAALAAEGRSVTVVNAGVSGDTTSGGLARLDWSVPDTSDVVILELGANDALRGIAPAITKANLDRMLTRLKAKGVRVLLAGMIAPPNMGADYADAFNPIYPALAAKHGVPLYPFFLEGVAADAALNQADKMHPNADGVARIVKRILPAVNAELDALAAPPAG